MAPLQQFNRSAMGRIADAVRVVESMPGSRKQDGRGRGTPMAREVRWARTTTNAAYPSYPGSGPCYIVEFGDYLPSPNPPYPGASINNVFTAYSPQWTEVATDPSGGTWAEDSIVRVERHDGLWWIRPASSSTYVMPAHVQGNLVGSGKVWQDGSGSADTTPYQLTTNGLWCFPSITGVIGNSIGTSITRNTPSTYSTEWLDLLQETYYLVKVHTMWALPSLSLSNARSLFRVAGHTHSYTDNGVGMTTGTTTPDARGLDDGGVVQVSTYVKQSYGGGEFLVGSSTLRPFYDSAGGTHVACHSGVHIISTLSHLESVRIHVVRDDSTAYVAPELYGGTVEVEQINPAEA